MIQTPLANPLQALLTDRARGGHVHIARAHGRAVEWYHAGRIIDPLVPSVHGGGAAAGAYLAQVLEERGLEEVIALAWSPEAADLEALAKRHATTMGPLVAHFTSTGGLTLFYCIATTPGCVGPATVRVGGDCLRDQCDLPSALARAAQLANEMLQKAAVAVPDVPTLLGGKKGVALLVDGYGHVVPCKDAATEDAMAVLLATAMPIAVGLSNANRGDTTCHGQSLSPVTMSPDVWTGMHWERMCEVWTLNGVSDGLFTCRPPRMGGFEFPSAVPTGRGVATAVQVVASKLDLPLSSSRIFMEAAGMVGEATLSHLLALGVPAENVTVVDPDPHRIALVQERFPGVDARVMTSQEAFGVLDGPFEIALINGLGNKLTAQNAATIGKWGVRFLTGGANGLFKESEVDQAVDTLFGMGCDVLPSAFANSGGWLSAVVGQVGRACGEAPLQLANAVGPIVERVISRAVTEALDSMGADGRLYDSAIGIVHRRVARLQDASDRETLAASPPRQILATLLGTTSATTDRDVTTGWEAAYEEHDGPSLWAEHPIPALGEFIEIARAHGTRTVLDVGCGDGRNQRELARAGFHTVGLDVSTTALQVNARRAHAEQLPGFMLRGDAESMQLGDQSVDAVTAWDVFGQIERAELFVAEAHRVLRPGGLLAFNAFSPRDSEFGLGERVGASSFLYKATLFRFYESEDLVALLDGWNLLSIKEVSWIDPPHGEFRPYEHKHSNWVVIARARGAVQ